MFTKAFVISILFLTAAANAQVADENLRKELLAMRDRDQRARDECNTGTTDERLKCYATMSVTVDKANTQRINEIYRSIGFPDAKQVGKDGVEAFLLILQHSNDIELKQKCLAGITKAFQAKQLSASDYANFTDRLLFNLGKPQVYGCNFELKDGKQVMSRTEDLKNLDRRRKKIGLPPIAEYAAKLKEVYDLEVVIPDLN
jgi:hypothetical protein